MEYDGGLLKVMEVLLNGGGEVNYDFDSKGDARWVTFRFPSIAIGTGEAAAIVRIWITKEQAKALWTKLNLEALAGWDRKSETPS